MFSRRLLTTTTPCLRSFSTSSLRLGVKVDRLSPGDGQTFPKKGDLVTIHYTGSLATNGKVFDSSVSRGQPFQCQIGVGQVIRGWDEGVVQLSVGEKKLTCTPDYAYGSQSVGGGLIPANSTLIFEVHLLGVDQQ